LILLFLPHSRGTQKRGLCVQKREAALMGGTAVRGEREQKRRRKADTSDSKTRTRHVRNLLVMQGHQRVDACGAPGGNVAGGERRTR